MGFSEDDAGFAEYLEARPCLNRHAGLPLSGSMKIGGRVPSLSLTWHLTGGPSKRKRIFQVPSHKCHGSGRKGKYFLFQMSFCLSSSVNQETGALAAFSGLQTRTWVGCSSALIPFTQNLLVTKPSGSSYHYSGSPTIFLFFSRVHGITGKEAALRPKDKKWLETHWRPTGGPLDAVLRGAGAPPGGPPVVLGAALNRGVGPHHQRRPVDRRPGVGA